MSIKFSLDPITVRLFYLKYRAIIVPLSIIVACLILFVAIIIPQVNGIFTAGEKNKSDLDRLKIVKNNLNLLNNTSDETLDSYFHLVESALPNHKDFEGVLDAVSVASQRSGVTLGNYEFKVGDLSKIEEEGKFPNLKLSLNITGSVRNVSNFMEELSKTLPLSEITEVNIGENFSNISVVFYYKASQAFTYNDSSSLTPISAKDISILNTLASFSGSLGK